MRALARYSRGVDGREIYQVRASKPAGRDRQRPCASCSRTPHSKPRPPGAASTTAPPPTTPAVTAASASTTPAMTEVSASTTSVLSAAPTPASSTTVPTTSATTPPTRDQRALLTLYVDDGDHGETQVIVRDKDILASVAALEEAGIHSFAGTREVVNGKPMVSLASLAPAITYKFDDRNSHSRSSLASTCSQLTT